MVFKNLSKKSNDTQKWGKKYVKPAPLGNMTGVKTILG